CEKMIVFTTRVIWEGNKKGKLICGSGASFNFLGLDKVKKEEEYMLPSEALVSAINMSFMGLILSYADKMKCKVLKYESNGSGIYERRKNSIMRIILHPVIVVEKEEDKLKIEDGIEKLKSYCPIANTLKCNIVIEPKIEVG
ncbi:MAG: OsmC family protein, partial [Candidatus Thermoplasmatota archaeon]